MLIKLRNKRACSVIITSFFIFATASLFFSHTCVAWVGEVDNGYIHAMFEVNFDGGGPNIQSMWYDKMWPNEQPNFPHDLMWYGQYDYVQVDGPWEDGTGNSIDQGWGSSDFSYMLSGGTFTPNPDGNPATADASIIWVRNELGVTYTVTQTFLGLPNQRLIEITYEITNDSPNPHYFNIYHADDFDVAEGGGSAIEIVYPYNGGNWRSGWPEGEVMTAGWYQGDGFALGLNTSTDSYIDMGPGLSAIPGTDNLPDDNIAIFAPTANPSDTQWYVGMWHDALYGMGQQHGGSKYIWETGYDISRSSPSDIVVGMMHKMNGGNPILPGASSSFAFFIGDEAQASSAGKDIALTDVYVLPDPAETYEGKDQRIYATVMNTGVAPVIEFFPVDFYEMQNLGDDPDTDNNGMIGPMDSPSTHLGQAWIMDGLNPGESKTVNISWSTSGRVGTHDFWAVADYPADGAVDEINAPFYERTNNRRELVTSGGVSSPYYEVLPPGKDLATLDNNVTIEPDYGSTYSGTVQYINATVWNLGDTDVTENFTVSFYTGGDPDIDDDGIVDSGSLLGAVTITNSPIDSIPPSGFKTASFSWDTTGRTGIHDIWVLVDYPADTGGNVVEINEIVNNQARYNTSGLTLGAEPPFVTNPPFYEVIGELPAPKNLTTNVIGANIVLTWEPVVASILDHYIIYCSNSQIDFEFGSTCATTTTIPWVDPSAITDGEMYYIVRAANDDESIISSTSNTAGKWTVTLPAGLGTLSKPLEYFSSSTSMTVHDLTLQLGANSISWQDALSDNWFVHEPSDGLGVDDTNIAVGDGYVVDLPAQTQITFTGLPAAMIKYDDSSPGFDPLTDAKSISAQVMDNDIDLTWSSLGAGIEYYVYWSDLRDGFFTGSYSILNAGSPVSGTSYSDVGAVSTAGENYYLIVPYHTATGAIGSSTYSIGVWTAEYKGNDLFALPLKPLSGYKSADWYTDQIQNCLGIVYLENGIWKAHFKEFPEGVYDTLIEVGSGYDLTVYSTSYFSYTGW